MPHVRARDVPIVRFHGRCYAVGWVCLAATQKTQSGEDLVRFHAQAEAVFRSVSAIQSPEEMVGPAGLEPATNAL